MEDKDYTPAMGWARVAPDIGVRVPGERRSSVAAARRRGGRRLEVGLPPAARPADTSAPGTPPGRWSRSGPRGREGGSGAGSWDRSGRWVDRPATLLRRIWGLKGPRLGAPARSMLGIGVLVRTDETSASTDEYWPGDRSVRLPDPCLACCQSVILVFYANLSRQACDVDRPARGAGAVGAGSGMALRRS